MKVNLARSAGFCFGVKRALKIALDTAADNKASVYMLGDIVHNEEVVNRIAKAGIRKIKQLGAGKGKTLLIRAHGSSLKTLELANKKGYSIVDATCPMVKEIHTIATNQDKQGNTLIVIGDKKHDEVQGIIGQLKSKSLVVDPKDPLPIAQLKKIKRACIVVQSTQNLKRIDAIVQHIKTFIPHLAFHNTICQPTRTKQKEIYELPLTNDAVVIIGSKTSANTKRLFEISHSLNKNTHWVNSAQEINPAWFTSKQSVGVTAGASTPEETIQDVVRVLKSI